MHQFIIELALEAGKLITKARTEGVLSTEFKTPRDLVTRADLECEKFIVSKILERFPNDKILAEEKFSEAENQKTASERLWVIDPIDGTTNYSRGDSHACISIAACEGNHVVAGVVYCPFKDELYSASRGGGSYCNDLTIRVSQVSDLKNAIIIVGRPLQLEDTPEFLEMLAVVINSCLDFRRLGSAALDICSVAAGRTQGFFETLHSWDIAAACLIAKEAGASRFHFRPVPSDFHLPHELYPRDLLVASPKIAPLLYEKLSAIIK